MTFTPTRTFRMVALYLETLSTTQQTEQVCKAIRSDMRKAARMQCPAGETMSWSHLIEALLLVKAQAATKRHTSPNPIVKSALDGVSDHLTAAIEIARTYVDAPAAAS